MPVGSHLVRALTAVALGTLLVACSSDAAPVVTGAPPTTTTPPTTTPPATTTPPTTTGPAPSATTVPPAGPMLGDVAMRRCALSLQPGWCGTLAVPEDRDDPSGPTIDLRVVVVPRADTTGPAGTPLYVFAGGPGGAATRDLGWFATTFTGVHATSDIVLVDQLGTGDSNEVTTLPLPDLVGLSDDAARAALTAWWDGTLAATDVEPAMYTTTQAVDDLDDVRAALGHDRIDLFGASYGATAAQYYIGRHGEHVRAVVLDGATLLDVPIFERVAPNSQLALDALVARCAEDAACHAAFPDLAGEIRTLLAQVAEEPVVLPGQGADGTATTIDTIALASALHQALLDSTSAAALPALIDAAARGDWAAVAASGSAAAATVQPLMSWIIRCSEPWARFDPAEVARLGDGSYLAEAETQAARMQQVLCDTAPAGVIPAAVDPLGDDPADVPVLLLVGSADPQDPPGNLEGATVRFPRSTVVVVPGQGHTVAHLGCVPSIVEAFLAAPDPSGVDTSCVTGGGAAPPPFVLSL